jgi:hypothetical protein
MSALLVALQGVSGLLGLANLVLAIIVLIRLYNNEGAGQMVLGLICGLYLFIWGWQNAPRLGFARQMNAWKLVVLAQILLVPIFFVAISAAGPSAFH